MFKQSQKGNVLGDRHVHMQRTKLILMSINLVVVLFIRHCI